MTTDTESAERARTDVPVLIVGAGPTGLADAIAEAAAHETDAFMVFRDDLPIGERVAQALVDGFGAEEDDEVIEVRAGGRAGETGVQRWRIGERLIPPSMAA